MVSPGHFSVATRSGGGQSVTFEATKAVGEIWEPLVRVVVFARSVVPSMTAGMCAQLRVVNVNVAPPARSCAGCIYARGRRFGRSPHCTRHRRDSTKNPGPTGAHGTEAKHTAVQENTNIPVVAAVAIDIGARYARTALDLQAMPPHDINTGNAEPTSFSFQFVHTRCETPSNAVRTATECASEGMGVDCVGFAVI